ncbi:MAG TPA: hypothetical protein VMU64_07040 [Acidimicrobiales bacterium]|nr:hypothetical protein [Acidimicrobiales bacterium]
MSDPTDTEVVAYHEAAHVVAAHRLGIGVETVTLRPGLTLFAEVLDDDATAVAIYVAGVCAERIAWPDAPATFDHTDKVKAEDRAFSLTHDLDAMAALIDETTVRVTDLLVAEWRSVESIAFALLTARPERLDADDIRRIIKPCQLRRGGNTFRLPRRAARDPRSVELGSYRDGGAGSRNGDAASTPVAVAV